MALQLSQVMDDEFSNLTQEDLDQIMNFFGGRTDFEVTPPQSPVHIKGEYSHSDLGFSVQDSALFTPVDGLHIVGQPQMIQPQGSNFGSSAPLFYQQSQPLEILEPPPKQARKNVSNYTPLSPQPSGPFPEQNPHAYTQFEDPSTQLLNRLQTLQMTQQDSIQKIREAQKQVLLNPQKETFDALNQQQESLKKQIDSELKALIELTQTVVLAPHEIRKAFYLQQELQTQNLQLELYHQELQQLLLQPGMPTRCFVALVVSEQPLPMVLTKGKALEEPIAVQLLSGANVNLQSISPVKAIVNMDNPQGVGQKVLESEEERVDEFSHIAKFHLKFLNGTRKALANVKFGVQIQLPGTPPLAVESYSSSPFVVITNECQYEESDGILLKTETFVPLEASVLWPHFANKLQRYFLRGTRQDPVKPQRFLTKKELAYLNSKFFGGSPSINAKAFDEFWDWFGKGLQKLRYQRHLCSMWQNGLIYGFIDREGVNASLVNQEPGTFMIRFSERHPGTFAVGYVIDEDNPETRVRHYLIRPEDVYGSKKTLPDFLMESPQFSKFLVIHDFVSGVPKHRIVDKELVLEQYGAKKPQPEKPVNGYDPSLLGSKGKASS